MSKRPFNKIRKIEKKENLAEDKEEEEAEAPNLSKEKDNPKPTIFNLAPKRKINIINPDALKNNDDKQNQTEIKPSLGSKPNLFKGKREGNKLIINRETSNNNNNGSREEISSGDAPKPTPLVIKKRPIDFKNRQRENIVIQEEQSMGIAPEQSKELEVDQSTTFKRRPDLKLKRLGPKSGRPNADKEDIQEESVQFSRSNDKLAAPVQNRSPSPISYREINVEPAANISQGKVEKQKKRTLELNRLLNLEMDLYEQTLSIGNITPYQIYINKIKGGFLKNSLDQAFDQKIANSCQTLSFQYADFTNQCPQDYSVDVNRIEKEDQAHLFDQFILKMSPIIEELIKPTNTITEPPIFLLAFKPAFKAFVKCPYPIFIYRSEQFNLDLIVMGQKLYITEGEIQSVLMVGKNIVGGLKNGNLILWNGQNNKNSRLYNQIKEFTNTTNFQLPSHCTHHLEKYSPYNSQFAIVGLLHEERSEFVSLDSTGKIVKWEIEEKIGQSQSLKPSSVTELRNLVQRPTLKAYSIKKRAKNASYYINSSMGILVLNHNEISQKLESKGEKIVEFQIPKRSPLVYAITQSNSLHIYNELYSLPLISMDLNIGSNHLSQIIIPELEHDNRQIIILSVFYLADTAGKIYEVKLLENQYEYLQRLGNEEDYDPRKDKNVIFRGVNRAGETLESLRLMRDLKISSQQMQMGVNTEKSVSNLKSIIEKNRELMTLLQEQCAMMV